MTQSKKLLLIDGNSVAFRAFFAMHQQLESFVSPDGLHTNAIYAFNNMLDIILKEVQPDYALAAFDAGRTTFRTAQYADYKGGRSKTPEELSEQFPYLQELLKDRGITPYQLSNYEADDIIGTLAREADEQAWDTSIVTGDRDLTQLTSDHTTVVITVKGVTQLEKYTPQHVEDKMGIKPSQIIDLKGLMGDTSDNYPGVTKVGPKTALKLLDEYGSIENLYDHVDEMKKSKLKEHLIEDKNQAFLSKKLATIDRHAPLTLGLADIPYTGDHLEELAEFYRKLNFKSFLNKLQPAAGDDGANPFAGQLHEYTELTAANLAAALKPTAPQAFEIEMLDDNYHTSPIVGFVLGTPGHWYVSSQPELLQTDAMHAWLADESRRKYVFDGKRNYVAANRMGGHLQGLEFDLLLASYLLDVNNNSNDLGEIAHSYGDMDVQTDAEVYGTGAHRSMPEDANVFYQHLTQKAAAIYQLEPDLYQKLKDHEQDQLFRDMEMPLSVVLAEMEIAGITVDAERLKKMGAEFQQTLKVLEEKIYNEAGEKFNINSPKQLGVILFEKMNMPVIKKTKTGYSTSVDVLEKLKSYSPIIDDILNYRQIAKIQSTYVEGLLKSILPDHKVHTRYLQTLTQTGRLSSVDPNLQNIPIRLPEGRKIRQAFVPRQDGWEIFSSDYSQIELRVLASISGDTNMQEAFKEGRDIHANTAMKIFGLDDPSQVTPNMRRQAKATNFGIVYGISDYGLSQNIGISRPEAKRFIAAYFEQYPQVKEYTEKSVQIAREQGYVETLFHRRRYLPGIHSKNFNVRSFAERTAMNTPIQGSAADIIKVAMINMQQALRAEGLQATMLLQVHDELIFEAPSAEIETLKKLVPKVMDSAVKLAVPLKVESAYGPTWFAAK
ncbi:DNA polymerase I [Lactobacillus selangorensis]|uniref:DNA polymerase I n=1 Tax=Lactobacillus selangorensis TaxID=81857 RepID=A0A0R2FYY6_9LACO|nr:DNA polymerase I [Lactobacillus selangorensis]KRN29744.1 DNA polymerase I [Lactobacillus selangorensis]KRN33727.1 DNA polymerase I [Lactobacillus selangorensis]